MTKCFNCNPALRKQTLASPQLTDSLTVVWSLAGPGQPPTARPRLPPVRLLLPAVTAAARAPAAASRSSLSCFGISLSCSLHVLLASCRFLARLAVRPHRGLDETRLHHALPGPMPCPSPDPRRRLAPGAAPQPHTHGPEPARRIPGPAPVSLASRPRLGERSLAPLARGGG